MDRENDNIVNYDIPFTDILQIPLVTSSATVPHIDYQTQARTYSNVIVDSDSSSSISINPDNISVGTYTINNPNTQGYSWSTSTIDFPIWSNFSSNPSIDEQINKILGTLEENEEEISEEDREKFRELME